MKSALRKKGVKIAMQKSTSVPTEDVAADALTLLSICVLLWLVSLRLGKTWPVDFIWSGWPLLQCALIIARDPHGGLFARRTLTCALVALWGGRLTYNFVSRGGIGHEDWRYTDMRQQFGSHFWWVSFFSVFLGQSIFMFGGCLSLYDALLETHALDVFDAAAACVSLGAISLEATADLQMDAFQRERQTMVTTAPVIDRGVWLWSRHPNYFAEASWWWGLWFLSARSGGPGGLAWIGPAGITSLFLLISIKLLEDRQLRTKGAAYLEYMRDVPSDLIPIPPALARVLGPTWLTLGRH